MVLQSETCSHLPCLPDGDRNKSRVHTHTHTHTNGADRHLQCNVSYKFINQQHLSEPVISDILIILQDSHHIL